MGMFARAADYLQQTFRPATDIRAAVAQQVEAEHVGLQRVPAHQALRIGPPLPRRPDRHVWPDIVVGTWTNWDVPQVRAALEMHERGQFYQSALLSDFMLRDDRVASALQTRVLGVHGLPFEILPNENVEAKARARRAARDLQRDWGVIFPLEVLSQVLRWGVLEGFALSEIIWNTDNPRRWVPTLKVWHPMHVYYRLDLRKYVALTMEGPVEINPGDGKWALFAPNGEYRGWMTGLVRSLAIPFLLRQYTYRDWARYSEVHGMPIKGARVPAAASESDKKLFFSQVQNLANEAVILLPESWRGSEKDRFDLELIEAKESYSWQAFEKLILRCEASIVMDVLGQNLSGGEVQGGSFAAAKEATGVRMDYKRADVTGLQGMLCRQLLEPWAQFNYGDPELAPTPTWHAEPPRDQAALATTFKTVADGVAQFAAAGVAVDVPALAEQYDLPIKVAAPTAPVVAPAGTAPAVPPKLPAPAGRQAAAALARRGAPDVRGPAVAGQTYVDRVADKAIARGAKAVAAGMMPAVLDAVKRARSYDELRTLLVHSLPDMNEQEFQRVVDGASRLSIAAGAWSVGQEAE